MRFLIKFTQLCICSLLVAATTTHQVQAQDLRKILESALKDAAKQAGKNIERESGLAVFDGMPLSMKEAVQSAASDGFELFGSVQNGVVANESENAVGNAMSRAMRIVEFSTQSGYQFKVIAHCPGCEQFVLQNGDDAAGEPGEFTFAASGSGTTSVRVTRATCAAKHDGACAWYAQVLRKPR